MKSLKGKKVLVTGADGFIGSHLVERLVKEGATVRAFVYYNSFGHWGWLDFLPKNLQKRIDVFCGDVRDPNGVATAMAGRDVVFHLAALIGIPFSYHSPDSYVDTNIKGTLNVLQAARKAGVKKIIHTSTSEVYGTAQQIPISEDHPINPQSPYAATKSAADALALSFYRSFDTPVAVLRPFNTYGPRQSARAIIPTILSQVLSGQKTIKLGCLHSTRDFTFVTDTVDAFLRVALSNQSVGQVLNAGYGQEISVKDLGQLIERVLGKKFRVLSVEERKRPDKSEVERLLSDHQKIKTICGWAPKVSLEEGVRRTAVWVKQNINQYKPDIYHV